MANLIVLTFDNLEEAGKVRQTIEAQETEGRVSLNDSAIVIKDEDGQVRIKDELDRGVKVGFAGGGLLGLFIGLILGGPFASVLLGAAGGALVGSMADLGIQKNFVKEVSEALKPGSSALFIIARDVDPEAAIDALKPYKGKVYHTSLPDETEETLRRVLEEES